MKKNIAVLASIQLILVLSGCGSSDHSCDEGVFVQSCVDAQTLEICTYGEIAQYRCPGSWKCMDDDEKGASCKE